VGCHFVEPVVGKDGLGVASSVGSVMVSPAVGLLDDFFFFGGLVGAAVGGIDVLVGRGGMTVGGGGVGVNPASAKSGMVMLSATILPTMIMANLTPLALVDFFMAASSRVFYRASDDDQSLSSAAVRMAGDQCDAFVVGGLNVARVRLLYFQRLAPLW
jgi:hypothetical protein